MSINFEAVQEFVDAHRAQLHILLHSYFARDQMFLLRSDLIDGFDESCRANQGSGLEKSILNDALALTQEAAVQPPWIYLAVRPTIGRWVYLRLHAKTLHIERVTVSRFLSFKESLIERGVRHHNWPLEIDFGPFNREFPRLKETRSVGSPTFIGCSAASCIGSPQIAMVHSCNRRCSKRSA